MANVATALSSIPVKFSHGLQQFGKVTPVICTFDTLASDLTIFTPSISGYYGAILGMLYESQNAHTLTLKSGSTTYCILERTTFDGLGQPLGPGGVLMVGGAGEALKIAVGSALINTMLVYCAEFPSLCFTSR